MNNDDIARELTEFLDKLETMIETLNEVEDQEEETTLEEIQEVANDLYLKIENYLDT